MGHAEVAKAPAQAGDHILPVGPQGEIALGHGGCGGHIAGLHKAQGEDGGDEQGGQHQQALEEIGPAHGGEAAQEGVGNDDGGGNVHGHGGVDVHDDVEQGAAGLDGRRRVDGVGHQENGGAEDLQGLVRGLEAVGQILGDGDGVVGGDGEPAQTGGLKDPAGGIAQTQTDGDPDLADTGGVDGGGQAHQDPGAHIGSAGGQGRDPGAHLAAAEEVVLLACVLGAQEEEDADAQHEQEISRKNGKLGVIHSFLLSVYARAVHLSSIIVQPRRFFNAGSTAGQ